MDDTCQTKEVQPIFPSPEELWAKYRAESGITEAAEKMLAVPYYYREGMHEPRYYQWIAVNRVLTAIANGKRRALIVLATGTGKTLVAFQIIWRLLEARKVQRVPGFPNWNAAPTVRCSCITSVGGTWSRKRSLATEPTPF